MYEIYRFSWNLHSSKQPHLISGFRFNLLHRRSSVSHIKMSKDVINALHCETRIGLTQFPSEDKWRLDKLLLQSHQLQPTTAKQSHSLRNVLVVLSIHMMWTLISFSCLSNNSLFIYNSGRRQRYSVEQHISAFKMLILYGRPDLMPPWKYDSPLSDLVTCSMWITLCYTFLTAAVLTNLTNKRISIPMEWWLHCHWGDKMWTVLEMSDGLMECIKDGGSISEQFVFVV